MISEAVMAFHIHDAETDALVRELAQQEGIGLTEAVKLAVRDRLEARKRKKVDVKKWLEDWYRDFPPPTDRRPVTKEEWDALNDE
jgi:hypothetical protein